ncbi:MAG TPA: hypothetical protein VHB25_15985 [Gemmatimonadaceae bacterium]|jgi:hypothetical protein|nr:hypothetical protein [Gemmatimonadaceae bacterium]
MTTGQSGPNLGSSLSIPGTAEDFAQEPEGWGRMHKVLTRDLDRLQRQVRRLKHRAWPGALSFSLAAFALSLAVTGGSQIGDYYTTTPRPADPPSGLDWFLLGGGAMVTVTCFALGLVSRSHFRSDVDDVVTEIDTLKYGGDDE